MTALYLHIPFCRSKCFYCSFSSCAAGEQLYAPYAAALTRELTSLAETIAAEGRPLLTSLFIGGGTPTCLPGNLLPGIIRHALSIFGAGTGVEISVEANPGTVDQGYLALLVEAGVNRLSLGVQSFDNLELQRIGRIHDEAEAGAAIEAARSVGFANVNLDLMYGLPGQSAASWQNSLEKGLAFRPEHLSLYQLTVESGTPLATLVENDTIRLPAEGEIVRMDDITARLCPAGGLHQYETSNYAGIGRECRHNINYWLNNDYLAAGAAAVSCRQGVRERRIGDPAEYIRRIKQNQPVVVESEQLSREASFRESVIMGLRMVRGVSRAALHQRYGLELRGYYGVILDQLIDQGLVELSRTHLRLTGKGWPLANRIMAELV